MDDAHKERKLGMLGFLYDEERVEYSLFFSTLKIHLTSNIMC